MLMINKYMKIFLVNRQVQVKANFKNNFTPSEMANIKMT